jgi:hypothetical protein
VQWRPCVPSDWERFTVRIRQGCTDWQFTIELSDEKDLQDESTTLVDDGLEHRIVIRRHAAAPETWPEDERQPAVNRLEPHSVPVTRRPMVADEAPESLHHDDHAAPATR